MKERSSMEKALTQKSVQEISVVKLMQKSINLLFSYFLLVLFLFFRLKWSKTKSGWTKQDLGESLVFPLTQSGFLRQQNDDSAELVVRLKW